MWKLALILMLTSCALPDPFMVDNCTAYGVYQGERMGPVREEIALPEAETQAVCGDHTGRTFAGCVKPNPDGTVNIYYRSGDRAARNHEIAHAMCGPQHTGRYYRDVITAHPSPYSPAGL